jgi:predicted XRE-type DNA-binding protein
MKHNPLISKNAKELATAMGLDACDALEWEFRYSLTQRIIAIFKARHMTVTEVANKAKTSRARITHILKADSQGISIDVLLRILAAVGQRVKITYKKAA